MYSTYVRVKCVHFSANKILFVLGVNLTEWFSSRRIIMTSQLLERQPLELTFFLDDRLDKSLLTFYEQIKMKQDILQAFLAETAASKRLCYLNEHPAT